MTYSEDVNRAASTDTIDFLNARIEALQKRVEYLEEQNNNDGFLSRCPPFQKLALPLGLSG